MKTLVQIQNELKVPKGNFNSFGKYKYRSCEDILEAVKPILAKHEAVLVITDSIAEIGGRLFLNAMCVLHLPNVEQPITSNGYAEISEHKGMSPEQATGTASSYARKYALNGLFLIDETESDADSQPKQQPKPIPTLERIRNAEKAIRANGGQVTTFNPTGKTEQELQEGLDALTEQYKRLTNK